MKDRNKDNVFRSLCKPMNRRDIPSMKKKVENVVATAPGDRAQKLRFFVTVVRYLLKKKFLTTSAMWYTRCIVFQINMNRLLCKCRRIFVEN
jgi:hypothetical protein